MEATVTSKGQLVIPAKLRRKLGLKKGSRLYLEERNGEIVIRPLGREYFQEMSGILKGGGLLKALEESRREDRKTEERRIPHDQGSR